VLFDVILDGGLKGNWFQYSKNQKTGFIEVSAFYSTSISDDIQPLFCVIKYSYLA